MVTLFFLPRHCLSVLLGVATVPSIYIYKTCVSLFILLMSMESKNQQIANQWALIKDILGPASLWPTRIHVLFMDSEFHTLSKVPVSLLCVCKGFVARLCHHRTSYIGVIRRICVETPQQESILFNFSSSLKGGSMLNRIMRSTYLMDGMSI